MVLVEQTNERMSFVVTISVPRSVSETQRRVSRKLRSFRIPPVFGARVVSDSIGIHSRNAI